MKCEIIRDLLPSYVDGLTSEESNREITAHVAECAPWRRCRRRHRRKNEKSTRFGSLTAE